MVKNVSQAQGPGPRSAAKHSPAPPPAPIITQSMRLAQLESQLPRPGIAQSWTHSITLRLEDIIEETNTRFDDFSRESVTLDDILGIRVRRVDRHEAELVD